jgi:hypothetical protein
MLWLIFSSRKRSEKILVLSGLASLLRTCFGQRASEYPVEIPELASALCFGYLFVYGKRLFVVDHKTRGRFVGETLN